MAASNISVSVRVRPQVPSEVNQSDLASARFGEHDNSNLGQQIVSVHGSNVCLSRPSQQSSLTTSTSVSSASLGRKIRNRYSGTNLSSSSFSKSAGTSANRMRQEMFTFDTCYHGENNSQQDVFRDIGEKAVCSTLDGFNCCVFAYGQTASGKTFTMFGDENQQGLTPRVLSNLMSRLAASSSQSTSNSSSCIKMGYLEIYNEKVRDLLGWRPASLGSGFSTCTDFELPSLKIREHPSKGVFVQGLTMHDLNSFDDACGLITQGNQMRVIGSTNVNEHSSRSHAIIIVKIIRKDFSLFAADGLPLGPRCGETSSKLHLVDLAGSERIKQTGATNKRMKEGISINQSLGNLGKTISLLVEFSKLDAQKKQAFHIPYRNSSLTFLLKDSLGGNSKTFMIATISGAAKNYTETRNTLLYASRARKVVNKPVVNQDINSKLVQDLKKEVECLKRLLAQAELAGVRKHKVSHEIAATSTKEDWTETSCEQESVASGFACCVHSTLMQEQLQKDEKELVDLMEQSVSPRDSLFSPELPLSEAELDTHEFGPPFICRVRRDVSTNVLQGMYFLTEGETKLGTDADKVHLLLENEPGIQPVHCSFFVEEDSVCLIRQEGAFVSVNGTPVMSHEFISHGCEIKLFENCVFTFSFPSQLASRLLREQQRTSSRNSSLFSPPMTASSCSSDAGGSRPLSELLIDIPAQGENFSCSSPEHASTKSLPCTSFVKYEHDLLSTASNSFRGLSFAEKSQQTDTACCDAFDRLETLQKIFINTFDTGLQEVLIGHEAVRDQIDCQLDLIRCDNRKMALLEQKLYAEVEEELAGFNKARHDLLKEREYLQKLVDDESLNAETLICQTSRIKLPPVFKDFAGCFETEDLLTENVSSSLDNLSSYRSSFRNPSDSSSSNHHGSTVSLIECEELLKQAKTNRSHLIKDVHGNLLELFQSYLKDMQKRQSLQLNLYRNEKKLAEVDRELSSISEKCHWLCSYCEKLREYFEAERTSMRDLEKKVGRFCCETKRELDSREDAMIQTKILLQRNMAKSCPSSPQKTLASSRPPNSDLCKSADNVFLPASSTTAPSKSSMIGCRTRKRVCKSLSKFDRGSNDWSSNEFNRASYEKIEDRKHKSGRYRDGIPSRDDADLFLHANRDHSGSSFSISSLPMQNTMPSSILPFRNYSNAGLPELVSVAVPSFRRRKSTYNYFHEYQIDVSLRDETWTVFHRFSALRNIHLALKSKYAELKFLDFPPRKAFGSRLERVAAERRVQLQQYLQSLVLLCMSRVKRMRMQGYSNANIASGSERRQSRSDRYLDETLQYGKDLSEDSGADSSNNSDDLCCLPNQSGVNRGRHLGQNEQLGASGYYSKSSENGDDSACISNSFIDKQLLLQLLPFLDPKYFNNFYSSVAADSSASSS